MRLVHLGVVGLVLAILLTTAAGVATSAGTGHADFVNAWEPSELAELVDRYLT